MWQPNSSGCHIWTGTAQRYGRFRFEGKLWLAHRWLFGHVHGYLPPEVCHTCDDGWCVNERHLFPGTHLDNMNDRDDKGRREPPKGDKNGRSRVTWDDVTKIRASNEAVAVLAVAYGVSKASIYDIRSGRTWIGRN